MVLLDYLNYITKVLFIGRNNLLILSINALKLNNYIYYRYNTTKLSLDKPKITYLVLNNFQLQAYIKL